MAWHNEVPIEIAGPTNSAPEIFVFVYDFITVVIRGCPNMFVFAI